jgi:anti-anti-sigma factor
MSGDGLRKDPVLGIETVDNTTVVQLGGELDLYNADQLRETFAEVGATQPARIVVDLTEVEFMDSTALGALIEARTRVPEGTGFLIAAPGVETRRALQISGLDRHFSVYDSLSDALAAKD